MSTTEPSPEPAAERLREQLADGLRRRVGAAPLGHRPPSAPKWRPLRVDRRPRLGPDLPHPHERND